MTLSPKQEQMLAAIAAGQTITQRKNALTCTILHNFKGQNPTPTPAPASASEPGGPPAARGNPSCRLQRQREIRRSRPGHLPQEPQNVHNFAQCAFAANRGARTPACRVATPGDALRSAKVPARPGIPQNRRGAQRIYAV